MPLKPTTPKKNPKNKPANRAKKQQKVALWRKEWYIRPGVAIKTYDVLTWMLITLTGGFFIGGVFAGMYWLVVLTLLLLIGEGIFMLKLRDWQQEKADSSEKRLKGIEKMLKAKNDPYVTIENMPVVLFPNQSPIVMLHLFNHESEMAYEFLTEGFYRVIPWNFKGTLEAATAESIGGSVDIPGKTKMNQTISWLDWAESAESVARIESGSLALFVYLRTSYKNKAGKRIPCVQGGFFYDSQLKVLTIAPVKFGPETPKGKTQS